MANEIIHGGCGVCRATSQEILISKAALITVIGRNKTTTDFYSIAMCNRCVNMDGKIVISEEKDYASIGDVLVR